MAAWRVARVFGVRARARPPLQQTSAGPSSNDLYAFNLYGIPLKKGPTLRTPEDCSSHQQLTRLDHTFQTARAVCAWYYRRRHATR